MEAELKAFFSICRLNRYQLAEENFDDAMKRYQWNLQLAEALLPVLCYLEIGLRNGLNRAIAEAYGTDWLLQLPSRLNISAEDRLKIKNYKDEICSAKGWNATHDDILAKLGFGFWGAFFRASYDPILWHKSASMLLLFPNLPRSLRSRRYIAPKLHAIRILRNRIAHHEPIWHLPDLQTTYQTCIELIHGMSLQAARQLAAIDRFHNIYAAGLCHLQAQEQ